MSGEQVDVGLDKVKKLEAEVTSDSVKSNDFKKKLNTALMEDRDDIISSIPNSKKNEFIRNYGNANEPIQFKKSGSEFKAKFEAALPLLEKYLTINEEEGSVWDLLGKVYANLGMADKSKEAFEKADLYK